MSSQPQEPTRDSRSVAAVEQLKAYLAQPSPGPIERAAEVMRGSPRQEFEIPRRSKKLLANVEATIAWLRRDGERVAVVRFARDSDELADMGVQYGAELAEGHWLLPEPGEAPNVYVSRLLRAERLDMLVIHHSMRFARLFGYRTHRGAERLWIELAALCWEARCQVTLISHVDKERLGRR